MTKVKHRLYSASEWELEQLKNEWLSPWITTADFKQKYKVWYQVCLDLFWKRWYYRTKQDWFEYQEKRSRNFDDAVEKRFKIIQKKFSVSRKKVVKLLTRYTFTEIYNAKDINNIEDLINI